MTFIRYEATGTEAIKNWELMTKPATTKLSYDESEEFWPFHETFLTHIENMGWNDILTFTVNGVNKDLSTQFGEISPTIVRTDKRTHETAYNAAVAAGNVSQELTTKQTKGKAMYTYLLNSIDERYKRHMTNNFDAHQRWGPLAWKTITEHSVKNDNQTIRRALCKTHTLSLADYDYDVDKLINFIQENNRILTSSGESDRSIAANLFRILKEAPNEEFVSWVLSKQTIWDEGLPFDLENFMKNAKSRYMSLKQDNLWNKNTPTAEGIKKESEIAALNTKLENLEALLASQSKALTAISGSTGNNKTSTSRGWRNVAPKSGQPETIERNGKKYFWCAHHGFWSPTHGTSNCRKGPSNSSNNGGSQPSLSINLADQSVNIPNDYGIMLATSDFDIPEQIDNNSEPLNSWGGF